MRTWLFAPGHETKKARKAFTTAADFVILDWEDAVPDEQKEEAREVSSVLARELETHERLVIRVNSPRTPHFREDLKDLSKLAVAGVMLPKAEDPSEVEELAQLELPMILIIESALGVERASALAGAHPLVQRLAFGPLDLLADLGGHWTPEGEETLYARSRVAIADRAAGLAGALDGPYPRLRDLEGLREDATRARRLGYVGKLLIHPAQIDVVREVFSPTQEEIDLARRILQASEEARAEGRGATSVDGRFIDPPVIRWAEQVLSLNKET